MVESYHPFNSQKAFSKDSVLNKMCFLKLIGKVPENFDEFAEKANDLINENKRMYNAYITRIKN